MQRSDYLTLDQIGINYFGQSGELRGCINDAQNIVGFLCSKSVFKSFRSSADLLGAENFGYKKDDIVTLTDDTTNPRQKPTRDNIVRERHVKSLLLMLTSQQIHAMQWLVRGAAPNDSLFFHCEFNPNDMVAHVLIRCKDSGHGGQTKDLDGDEGDGYDEGLSRSSHSLGCR